MACSSITRRQIIKWLAASLLAGGSRTYAQVKKSNGGSVANETPITLTVAAIQMSPKLGDVSSNLNQAEQLVRKALQKGARWIVLPEMFTSAAAFHPDMLKAIQPIDGAPLQLLKRLAREGNAVIGGSFLARHGQQVFNTFVLVFSDGSVVQHDKDLPTYWENCYYKKARTTAYWPRLSALWALFSVGNSFVRKLQDGWRTRSRWSWAVPVGGHFQTTLMLTVRVGRQTSRCCNRRRSAWRGCLVCR